MEKENSSDRVKDRILGVLEAIVVIILFFGGLVLALIQDCIKCITGDHSKASKVGFVMIINRTGNDIVARFFYHQFISTLLSIFLYITLTMTISITSHKIWYGKYDSKNETSQVVKNFAGQYT